MAVTLGGRPIRFELRHSNFELPSSIFGVPVLSRVLVSLRKVRSIIINSDSDADGGFYLRADQEIGVPHMAVTLGGRTRS